MKLVQIRLKVHRNYVRATSEDGSWVGTFPTYPRALELLGKLFPGVEVVRSK